MDITYGHYYCVHTSILYIYICAEFKNKTPGARLTFALGVFYITYITR